MDIIQRIDYILNEEYKGRLNLMGDSFELFRNPTSRELRSTGAKEFRFIADALKKEVWVWDSYASIHLHVYNRGYGKHTNWKRDLGSYDVLWGIADLRRGPRLTATGCDELLVGGISQAYGDSVNIPKLRKRMEWLERYMDTDYLFELIDMKYGD